MIFLIVNLYMKKIMMLSLECDILIKIQYKDGSIEEVKLNAVYVGGGVELVILIIQKMMNIYIDCYIMVNMYGL